MGLPRRPTRIADAERSGLEPNSQTNLHQSDSDAHSSGDEFVRHDKEVLDRTAVLIAAGEEPFPTGAPLNVQNYLAHAVREMRRKDLLSFVSRQLALVIGGRSNEANTRKAES